jgi:hypothetical protein
VADTHALCSVILSLLLQFHRTHRVDRHSGQQLFNSNELSYAFSPHTLGTLLNNNKIDKIARIFLHFVQRRMKKQWFLID